MKTRGIGRRRFLTRATAAIGTAALTRSLPADAAEPTTRPNILLICSDQQHWEALGVVDPRFDTPHLDALAATATRFEHAYCTTPQCSPSRSTIYTGLYPHRTGVIGNIGSIDHHGEPVPGLRSDLDTLASRLRRAGYHTGYTGKWHLDRHDVFTAHFDEAQLDGDAHGGATDQALTYLTERTREPERHFALMVNYINPHDIYDISYGAPDLLARPPTFRSPPPPSFADTLEGKPVVHREFMTDDQGKVLFGQDEEFWERYREVYRDKCRLLDVEVGRLLGALDASGLAERTIVVFVSDHGDMDTQHRLIYKGPFMYEHMVRVPLLIRVPEAFGGTGARVCPDFAVLSDLTPTLCAFAETDGATPDGASWRGFLTGDGPAPHRDYVVSQYYNKQSWTNPIRMLRTKKWKYNRYIDHGEELYDLLSDPHELHNLAADPGYARTKTELRAGLDRWMTEHDDAAFDACWSTHRDGTRRFSPPPEAE